MPQLLYHWGQCNLHPLNRGLGGHQSWVWTVWSGVNSLTRAGDQTQIIELIDYSLQGLKSLTPILKHRKEMQYQSVPEEFPVNSLLGRTGPAHKHNRSNLAVCCADGQANL